MSGLRGYQLKLKAGIYDAWGGGARNVLGVLPTGGGKTRTFADIILDRDAPSCAIAHRQELVGQISLALAREGVRHRIIGPTKVVKMCVNQHMEKLGRSYFDPNSWHAVAGVDTLIRRKDELRGWASSVRLWVEDEAHHVLTRNKWGESVLMFPNANGLGVTATPTRADGHGLGSDSDGVFDEMVEGPSMRELIDAGYLTDYIIYAPKSEGYVRPTGVGKASGDFTRDNMKKATRESKIVGDIVEHYLRIAPGKLGVTFMPDIESAKEVAAQFNARGVPAEACSSLNTDEERISMLRRFERREILQLVNVDLFGEGFDLPAIEVISFGRPTESLSLYIQQFGRVLRLMLAPELHARWEGMAPEQRLAAIASSSKPRGIVIDHVGNVERHQLPDSYRAWSLDRRERRSSGPQPGVVPMWTCNECLASWERIHGACLACGHPKPPPMVRSGPEFVDGDLVQLTPDVLAAMRAAAFETMKDPEVLRAELAAKHMPKIGQLAHVKKQHEKIQAQTALRESLAWWGGYQRSLGRDDSESYRRFYFTFGMDILTAQTLKTAEALALRDKVESHLAGVVRA